MGKIVLVHGAFHGSWCWDGVVSELRRRDIDVDAVELPFTGFDNDVEAARSAISAAGPGAVVCCHSYGGVVTDHAVIGLPNVRSVVYVAALINNGTDLFAADPPAIVSAIVADGDLFGFAPSRAHEIFYADSDASTVAALVPLLRPMVFDVGSFLGDPPPRPVAHTTYVVCTNDGAVPVAAQRQMATACDTQVEWPTDHSPFLTRPDVLADLLLEASAREGK
jgi:Alpha/beta hydrolase family